MPAPLSIRQTLSDFRTALASLQSIPRADLEQHLGSPEETLESFILRSLTSDYTFGICCKEEQDAEPSEEPGGVMISAAIMPGPEQNLPNPHILGATLAIATLQFSISDLICTGCLTDNLEHYLTSGDHK